MYPEIVINDNIAIPTYYSLFIVGFTIGVIICLKLNKENRDDILHSFAYAFLGIGVGAKAFYFFSMLPRIIVKFDSFLTICRISPLTALNFAFGGLVFYGGIVGAYLGIYIYCRQYKINHSEILHAMIPFAPFIHCFGRIGCFMAGCCYGIEYDGPLSVRFPESELVPDLSYVNRFPVQLLEATLDLVIFAILIYLGKKISDGYIMLAYYGIMYAIVRFFDEFLRGDSIRGVYGFLSTSQIISIIIAIGMCVVLYKRKKIASSIENNIDDEYQV